MFSDYQISNMGPKLTFLTLDTKYQPILKVEKGEMNKVVDTKFGIPPSTLSTWLSKKVAIKVK